MNDDLAVRESDIAAVNEEITNKYSIIENLQSEADVLEEKTATLEEAKQCLEAQVGKLETENTSLKEELTSKNKSLDMLQTTIDVMEKSQSDTGDLSNQLAALQRSILEKENEITSLQGNLQLVTEDKDQLVEAKGECEGKISVLEDELQNFETLTVELAECRKELTAKELEIESLNGKLETMKDQISTAAESASVATDSFYFQQQTEQIEMLRAQLREKCDLLESSKSDQNLISQLETKNDDLEAKTQEVEDMRDKIRRLEVDKQKLESKMAEVEQYRQELSKESNQHMEEASEKIRELKSQLDAKVEDMSKQVIEKEALLKDLAKSQDEVKQLETKYNQVLENASEAELIRERDQFKEKNEKLTGMCKKYIAKIKQLDAQVKQSESTVDNAQVEEFNNRISSLEFELQESKSGNAVLQEEMMSKYQVIANLQSQVEAAQIDLESTSTKLAQLQLLSQQKEQENEDLVRNLKQKLEDTPENVSVAVDVSEAAAEHEKTKTELSNLREKCKKLIVKVKQQDAIIKKKRHESNSSEVSTTSTTTGEDQSGEEVEKLKKLSSDLEAANKTLQQEVEELRQLSETLQSSKTDLEGQNNQLTETINENEEKHQKSANKQQCKIDEFKKQIAQLTSEQVELKDAVKELSVTNQQLKTKCEDAVEEVKKMHEANLVSQMEASPLLAAVTAQEQQEDGFSGFEEDREDGWGSPEPEKSKPVPEPVAEPEVKEESDGWGGWDDGNDEIKIDDDGLKSVDNDGDNMTSKVRAEREADIEDGWGDDSWGGFGEETVADNLR